jgi:hypothetical protein
MSVTDAAPAALGVGPASLGLPPTVSVDLTAVNDDLLAAGYPRFT